MKWGFLLGSPDISGGTYVIFEHAIRALAYGDKITIITEQKVKMEQLFWHREAEQLIWKTYDEVIDEEFDVLIATWWRTVYEAYRVSAKHYLYFVQSIESRFYSPEEKPIKQLVDATYFLPFEIITEATWIKKYLFEKYNKNVYLVRNGIRKDIYTKCGEAYGKRDNNKLRVLVEGPVDSDFKNIPKTVQLCRMSKADEIWLMTSSNITEYEGVDRVFSKVPIFETPKIYRSCDVIVKLSYVEGMFGPPLEMYHCGGTSLTYDVTGYDEYIVHNQNGIVVKTDQEEEVVHCINKLKEDRSYLDRLKQGARETADSWCSWEESSKSFYDVVHNINKTDTTITRKIIEDETKFHFKSYVIAEDYLNELKILRNTSLLKRAWIRLKRKIPVSVKLKLKQLLNLK